jgi:hypothetical protein
VPLDHKDRKAKLVPQVPRVFRAKLEPQVQVDLLEQLDHKDHKAKLEPQVRQDLLEQLDHKDHKDHKAHKDLLEQLEQVV